MEIKGVSNGSFFVNRTKNNATEAKQETELRDKLEISTEARDLLKTELSGERVTELRQKISDGYYSSDAVLQKVAEKLIVDLKI